MITLITGAPGAGKTSALVSLLLALSKDRVIYCDGIPDLTIAHVPLTDPNQWPDLVEDGAAVVIDEVQRVWRPRGSAAKVPPAIEALETHRHRGLDFFIITQHPGLVDANVRRLVGRHIHLRDVGLLGRWWYEWPECANPETFKSAPIKKRYRIDKKSFGAYKSASIHVKPIRSVPASLVLLLVALVAFVALTFWAYRLVASKQSPKAAGPAGAASAVGPAASRPDLAVMVSAPVEGDPAPGFAAFEKPAPYAPAIIAGCWASASDCWCVTNDVRPRIVQPGPACLAMAQGDVGPHPSRPAVAAPAASGAVPGPVSGAASAPGGLAS